MGLLGSNFCLHVEDYLRHEELVSFSLLYGITEAYLDTGEFKFHGEWFKNIDQQRVGTLTYFFFGWGASFCLIAAGSAHTSLISGII